LRQAAVGSSLVCTFGQGWQTLLGMARPMQAGFDLLVKGGKVVDPSQRLSANRDIGIRDGKVVALAENIAEAQASQVLDARGKIVTGPD
jgi:adenine deaminase